MLNPLLINYKNAKNIDEIDENVKLHFLKIKMLSLIFLNFFKENFLELSNKLYRQEMYAQGIVFERTNVLKISCHNSSIELVFEISKFLEKKKGKNTKIFLF